MHRIRTTLRLVAVALAAAAMIVPNALGASSAPPPGTRTAKTFHGTPTVGPLFVGAASAHFCTASVVDSPRGDVLLTAAHCVVGTGAGLVFAPGFHGGVAPRGRWTVTAAYLDPAWLKSQDPRRDFAFLLVAPRRIGGRSREIEQVTGANRLGFTPRARQRVTIPAYPAGANNDPITCTARVYFTGVYPAFNCNPYPGGTSGAPWLSRGRAVGLIGGLHQGGCFTWTSYSPPFTAAIHRVYERAIRRATPDVAPPAGTDGC